MVCVCPLDLYKFPPPMHLPSLEYAGLAKAVGRGVCLQKMMSQKKKHFLQQFLALILFLSCLILPLFAAPLSKGLALRNQDSAAQQVVHQKAENIGGEIQRMDIEINDYPGSGANNRHDPKSPGRE